MTFFSLKTLMGMSVLAEVRLRADGSAQLGIKAKAAALAPFVTEAVRDVLCSK